jgi:large subunit ribosomal protein L3
MTSLFTKIGMSNAFDPNGKSMGVTILQWHAGRVIRHEKLPDGRVSVIVEYMINQKKNPANSRVVTKGFVTATPNSFPVDSVVNPPEWAVGDKLKVTGTSKGRGFQGVMKRFNFAGGPAAHGSRFHRAPGSSGMRTQPGRVMPGKPMPGHYGDEQVSVRNVKVVVWSQPDGMLAVMGGIPGSKGGFILI